MNNATEIKLTIDKKEQQLKQLLYRLQHILHTRIAEINQQSVWDDLYDLFHNNDVVVISSAEFKYYQQLEKLSIEKELLLLNVEVKKIDQ